MSVCASCGEATGNYTLMSDGDPYGDAKFVGIPVGSMKPYCLNCSMSGNYPNLSDEIGVEYVSRGWCGFLEAWVGRCRNAQPCSRHSNEKCWKCGELATRNCGMAGSLVCGVPECAKHPHEHK